MPQKSTVLVIHPRTALIGSAFVLGSLALTPHAVLVPTGPIPERAAVLPELDPRLLGITPENGAPNRKALRKKKRLARAR